MSGKSSFNSRNGSRVSDSSTGYRNSTHKANSFPYSSNDDVHSLKPNTNNIGGQNKLPITHSSNELDPSSIYSLNHLKKTRNQEKILKDQKSENPQLYNKSSEIHTSSQGNPKSSFPDSRCSLCNNTFSQSEIIKFCESHSYCNFCLQNQNKIQKLYSCENCLIIYKQYKQRPSTEHQSSSGRTERMSITESTRKPRSAGFVNQEIICISCDSKLTNNKFKIPECRIHTLCDKCITKPNIEVLEKKCQDCYKRFSLSTKSLMPSNMRNRQNPPNPVFNSTQILTSPKNSAFQQVPGNNREIPVKAFNLHSPPDQFNEPLKAFTEIRCYDCQKELTTEKFSPPECKVHLFCDRCLNNSSNFDLSCPACSTFFRKSSQVNNFDERRTATQNLRNSYPARISNQSYQVPNNVQRQGVDLKSPSNIPYQIHGPTPTDPSSKSSQVSTLDQRINESATQNARKSFPARFDNQGSQVPYNPHNRPQEAMKNPSSIPYQIPGPASTDPSSKSSQVSTFDQRTYESATQNARKSFSTRFDNQGSQVPYNPHNRPQEAMKNPPTVNNSNNFSNQIPGPSSTDPYIQKTSQLSHFNSNLFNQAISSNKEVQNRYSTVSNPVTTDNRYSTVSNPATTDNRMMTTNSFNKKNTDDCNICNSYQQVKSFKCGNKFCEECLTLKCFQQIVDFFKSQKMGQPVNVKQFTYLCPIPECKGKISVPTVMIIEKYKIFRGNKKFQEFWQVFDLYMNGIEAWIPFFDGLHYDEIYFR